MSIFQVSNILYAFWQLPNCLIFGTIIFITSDDSIYFPFGKCQAQITEVWSFIRSTTNNKINQMCCRHIIDNWGSKYFALYAMVLFMMLSSNYHSVDLSELCSHHLCWPFNTPPKYKHKNPQYDEHYNPSKEEEHSRVMAWRTRRFLYSQWVTRLHHY